MLLSTVTTSSATLLVSETFWGNVAWASLQGLPLIFYHKSPTLNSMNDDSLFEQVWMILSGNGNYRLEISRDLKRSGWNESPPAQCVVVIWLEKTSMFFFCFLKRNDIHVVLAFLGLKVTRLPFSSAPCFQSADSCLLAFHWIKRLLLFQRNGKRGLLCQFASEIRIMWSLLYMCTCKAPQLSWIKILFFQYRMMSFKMVSYNGEQRTPKS